MWTVRISEQDPHRDAGLCLFREFGGNVGNGIFRAFGFISPEDGFHLQQIDHADKLVFFTDRHLNSNRVSAQTL